MDFHPTAVSARMERMRALVSSTCGSGASESPALDDVPVVFIHQTGAKGRMNESYLELTQSAAADSNNHVIVVMLTGETRVVDPRIELITLNISDPTHPWIRRAHEFGRHYVHFSSNQLAFERVAIQKYFVLAELMRARNYSRLLFLDSDVLLLTNATQEQLCYGDCDVLTSSPHDLRWSGYASAHTSLWSQAAMLRFADYIFDAYTVHFARIRQFWDNYRDAFERRNATVRGGFNDMTLAGWFSQYLLETPALQLTPCNNLAPVTTAGIMDHMRGYKYLPGFYQDDVGLPAVAQNGATIPLKSLHFQGDGKYDLMRCGRARDELTTPQPALPPS